MTIGDVLATIGLLLGTYVSSWALTLAYGLLFPARSAYAKTVIEDAPWRAVGRGALIMFTIGLVGYLLLAAAPNPLLKAVGVLILLAIFLIAGLGMAGIALNAADRLRSMAPELSHYASFTRGAAFVLGGCIVPIVGWLAFAPLVYMASIGAGWKAAFGRIGESRPIAKLETA